jgi:Type IV secretion system pilin
MNKLKIIMLSLTTMFSVLAVPAVVFAADPAPATTAATGKDAVCQGVSFATGADGAGACNTDAAAGKIPGIVNLAIRLFQMVIGIIAIFTVIQAGLSYITSGGDAAKTKTARERIIYAAVGLFVVVLAEIIVRFVLNRVASVA